MSTDAQSMVDHYVNEIIDFVIDHPFSSIPQIFEIIARGGPCASPKTILRLTEGPRMFKRICRGTECLRWASAKDRLGLLQLAPDSDSPRDRRYSIMHGIRDEFMERWAPDRRDSEPFSLDLPEVGGAVMRYPSQIDTDDYFSDTEGSDETLAEDSDGNMRFSE